MHHPKDNHPILIFTSQAEWRQWLEENHRNVNAVWLLFYKKDSGKKTFGYAEALEEALCYGWIDGVANKYNEESYLQRFTPRRAKSIWSKVNREHIERLTKAGKMKPSGVAEVERAKADGRWEAAYDSPSHTTVPEDFLKRLAQDKKAEAFFKTLNKTNVFAITWRLQTAKKLETREKRMQKILEMLSKGEKLH